MVFRKREPRPPACSFCGLGAAQVSKLIAGPSVHICGDCVGLCNKIIDEQTGASFPEAETEEAQLAALRATSHSVDAMAELLHERVAALREREVSWQRIADALGTSRQAAWERFR